MLVKLVILVAVNVGKIGNICNVANIGYFSIIGNIVNTRKYFSKVFWKDFQKDF